MILSPLSEQCKFCGCYTTLRGFYNVPKHPEISDIHNPKETRLVEVNLIFAKLIHYITQIPNIQQFIFLNPPPYLTSSL
jgi:hypothetical protein